MHKVTALKYVNIKKEIRFLPWDIKKKSYLLFILENSSKIFSYNLNISPLLAFFQKSRRYFCSNVLGNMSDIYNRKKQNTLIYYGFFTEGTILSLKLQMSFKK